MEVPKKVGCDESIGRALSRSTPEKAKDEANVHDSLMYPFTNQNKREISTSRLSLAEQHGKLEHVEQLADKLDDDPNRTFYGWAKFLTRDVRRVGFCVVGSPIRDRTDGTNNEYHADIVLPSHAVSVEDVEELIQDLLSFWKWCPSQELQFDS